MKTIVGFIGGVVALIVLAFSIGKAKGMDEGTRSPRPARPSDTTFASCDHISLDAAGSGGDLIGVAYVTCVDGRIYFLYGDKAYRVREAPEEARRPTDFRGP